MRLKHLFFVISLLIVSHYVSAGNTIIAEDINMRIIKEDKYPNTNPNFNVLAPEMTYYSNWIVKSDFKHQPYYTCSMYTNVTVEEQGDIITRPPVRSVFTDDDGKCSIDIRTVLSTTDNTAVAISFIDLDGTHSPLSNRILFNMKEQVKFEPVLDSTLPAPTGFSVIYDAVQQYNFFRTADVAKGKVTHCAYSIDNGPLEMKRLFDSITPGFHYCRFKLPAEGTHPISVSYINRDSPTTRTLSSNYGSYMYTIQ